MARLLKSDCVRIRSGSVVGAQASASDVRQMKTNHPIASSLRDVSGSGAGLEITPPIKSAAGRFSMGQEAS